MMTARQIRSHFLTFFASKQHKIVGSAPIVNREDPTLMFTNAGMNQFKDFFLGNKIPDNPRIADTQKCLRVSGIKTIKYCSKLSFLRLFTVVNTRKI